MAHRPCRTDCDLRDEHQQVRLRPSRGHRSRRRHRERKPPRPTVTAGTDVPLSRHVGRAPPGGGRTARPAGRARHARTVALAAGYKRAPNSGRHPASHRPKFCALLVPRLCTEGPHRADGRGSERERHVQTIARVCWVSPRRASFLFGPSPGVRLPAPPQISTSYQLLVSAPGFVVSRLVREPSPRVAAEDRGCRVVEDEKLDVGGLNQLAVTS